MEHLGDRRQRLDRPGTHTALQQQVGEIARPGFPGGGEGAVQAPEEDVGSADLVMGRHLQAGQLVEHAFGRARQLERRLP